MRFTYDPRHGVACIRLREPSGPVETICVSDELNVDPALDHAARRTLHRLP
jgi:uncharacterized protein YuzE